MSGQGQPFEGWWEPTPESSSPKLHGKIEWEPTFDEDGMEIDVLVSKLELDEGEEIEVTCEGSTVLTAPVDRKGKVRHAIRSTEGHTIPDLSHKRVELRHRGTVLATAVLEPD